MDSDYIREIIKRIVNAVEPVRIILFGSAARGDAKTGSDLDICVVMPDGTHRRKTAMLLHATMVGMGIPVDIVVATPSDLLKHRETIGLVYKEILREGLELYAA